MAKTPSFMLPLGTVAPPFILKDVTSDSMYSLNSSADFIGTVIMFICNHCPYVKYVNGELTQLANDYIPKHIRFIAINSNDVLSYPDDSPANMKITALAEQYPFPYLYDETQEVAKAYHATCTPDFFVFDKSMSLVYRGQLDDSRPGNAVETTGESIRMALNCLIDDKPLNFEQKPSIGCNIKWKT